jgi:hypothetical protein
MDKNFSKYLLAVEGSAGISGRTAAPADPERRFSRTLAQLDGERNP